MAVLKFDESRNTEKTFFFLENLFKIKYTEETHKTAILHVYKFELELEINCYITCLQVYIKTKLESKCRLPIPH